jgi:hypothetical protein
VIVTTTETKPTEQELALQLEEARRARIAEEKALAESQQRTAEALEERRQIAFSTRLRAEIAATGLKSYLSDEELKLVMQKEFKFNIGSNGSFSLTDERGRQVEFSAALESMATSKGYLFDGRTTQRLHRQDKEITRADLTTFAEKSEYIKKFGLEKFEQLKAKPSVPAGHVLSMNAAQYSQLSLAERSKFVATYGSDAVAEILTRR